MSPLLTAPDDPRLIVSRPPGVRPPAISLPRPPTDAPSFSFPIVATIAPVLGSVLIWAVTGSGFALVFAALAPIVAISSLVDARWRGRRHRRREKLRFSADVSRTLSAVAQLQTSERHQLNLLFPPIAQLLSKTRDAPDRWRTELRDTVALRVGSGAAQSALCVDGVVDTTHPADIRDALEHIAAAASSLVGAPMRVDARGGLAVCGPPTLSRAVARAYLIRLTSLLSPQTVVIRRPDHPDWAWLDELPHRVELKRPSANAEHAVLTHPVLTHPVPAHPVLDYECPRAAPEPCATIEIVSIGGEAHRPSAPAAISLAVAENPGDLPRTCHHRIDIAGEGVGRLISGVDRDLVLELEFASEEEAREWANRLRRWADEEGVTAQLAELPRLLPFSSLSHEIFNDSGTVDPFCRSSLDCVIGASTAAPWRIDLVADGPHAVVGGTTGSGKSELLTSWILALATTYSPDLVTFLLVDFKGGASFEAVRHLPHSVGIVTDLDTSGAARALESLRAELRYRERLIVAAGCKTIEEFPVENELPRLVIVVDEFAVLAEQFPELRNLFADIAARGRSLGVHLILCTQRPADALRETILANCTLRISLRVNSAADSVALIGSAAAANLPREPVGRTFVTKPGHPVLSTQVALADSVDFARVALRWPSRAPVRRPWCDPLPLEIAPGSLPTGAAAGRLSNSVAFALRDLPEEQRQDAAEFEPRRHGNLLVQGARGSGKSTALRTLAAGFPGARWISSEIGGAWDTVGALLTGADQSRSDPLLVLVDDLDLLVARFGSDHQREFVDQLARLLREGPSRGISLAISVQQLPALLNPVNQLCESRLLLRLTDRQEHAMAGGRVALFDPNLTPGGGFWGDHRVQVVNTPQERRRGQASRPAPITFLPGDTTAVVSSAPNDFFEKLTRAHPPSAITVVAVRDFLLPPLPAPVHPELSPAAVDLSEQHTVVLGDPDDWQAAWSLTAQLRHRQRLLFHRCSVADFRALTRSRTLPPPLTQADELWLVDDHARVTRVQLCGTLAENTAERSVGQPMSDRHRLRNHVTVEGVQPEGER